MRLSSSLSRSSMADDRPDFAAASMSSALACLMRGGVLLQSRGHRQQTGVLLRRRQLASSRDAALACLASRVICSVKVMQGKGKPKSRTGKCEVP